MATWFISDTHFGHANIIQYCGRPFASVEEMDAALIRNWNERVAPEDDVWHLGDFSLGGRYRIEYYRKQLNGQIHLIRGNHDRATASAYLKSGFLDVQSSTVRRMENGVVVLIHAPEHANLWEAVSGSSVWHGHVHERVSPLANGINLSVERTGYKPLSEREVWALRT